MSRRLFALAFLTAPICFGCGSSDSKSANSDPKDGGGGQDAQSDAPDVSATCGNGIVEGAEQCDEGDGNGPGTGCEVGCVASCQSSAECDDGEACNGSESCEPKGSGRACAAGSPPAEGSACATTGYCKAGTCAQPVCGNGQVEPGEACEPPTSGCSSKCQICGDGKVAGDEQCDDGNALTLDGCDPTCRYETLMRLESIALNKDAAPSFCAHPGNAFADAFADEVLLQFEKNLKDATDGASNNMILAFDGLDDLTGTDDTDVSFSMLSGLLDPRYETKWTPGAIDAWFVASSDDFDAAGKPNQLFGAGKIVSNVLTAGPGDLRIRAVLGTTINDLFTRDTMIRAMIDTTPGPDLPAPPPSALGAGQKVFRSLTATGPDQGLCANVTVDALSKTNIPGDFAIGANACQASCSDSKSYVFCGAGQPVGPSCNSMLDVMIGGCKVTVLCVPAITPTQPDVGTGGNPPAPITSGPNNKAEFTVPTDAYTIQLKFKAQRAHVTNNLP